MIARLLRQPTTRRALAPGLAALLPVTLGGGIIVPNAAAFRTWCRTDPLVRIEDALADIFVAAPLTDVAKLTEATRITVVVPRRVEAELVLNLPGASLEWPEVSFATSRRLKAGDRGIEVQIKVYVSATDDEMPVRIEFAPRVIGLLAPASVEGTANEWIVLRSRL